MASAAIVQATNGVTDAFLDAIAERVVQKMKPEWRAEVREAISEALEKKHPPTTFTPRQAAKYAHRSPNTIYAAIHSGELKFITNGSRYLIRLEALDEWMDQKDCQPSGNH